MYIKALFKQAKIMMDMGEVHSAYKICQAHMSKLSDAKDIKLFKTLEDNIKDLLKENTAETQLRTAFDMMIKLVKKQISEESTLKKQDRIALLKFWGMTSAGGPIDQVQENDSSCLSFLSETTGCINQLVCECEDDIEGNEGKLEILLGLTRDLLNIQASDDDSKAKSIYKHVISRHLSTKAIKIMVQHINFESLQIQEFLKRCVDFYNLLELITISESIHNLTSE